MNTIGEQRCYGGGRATSLLDGATGGVRNRAPDHYSGAEA